MGFQLPKISFNEVNIDNFYIPKHFKAYELVDRKTYSIRGEKSFELIDSRILYTIDMLREYYGVSIIINNWKFGGEREWSGLRTKESPYYSDYSQHSFGRAVDFLIKGIDSKIVRNNIKNNPNIIKKVEKTRGQKLKEFFKGLFTKF